MEQLPHWLAATVAAAGMTAYAEDVERSSANNGVEPDDANAEGEPPGTYH
jgi:hypothetical protein